MYLSFASKNALANGLNLIFNEVICIRKKKKEKGLKFRELANKMKNETGLWKAWSKTMAIPAV